MLPSVCLPVSPPEIRHSPEHAIGSGLAQKGLAVTRLMVAASDKSPNGHAGRLARLDTANAVLDDEGATWIRLHPFGCVKEEVGCRLAAGYHLRGIETHVEMRCEAGQGERVGHAIDITGRGDAMRDLQVLQYRVHPFDRAERREERSPNPCPQLGRKLLGDRASQRFVMLEDRRHASSQEQIERLIDVKADAVSRQRVGETATAQHLAIDQHAVAIENDEIGPGHHGFPAPIRAYTQVMGNNPLLPAGMCPFADRGSPKPRPEGQRAVLAKTQVAESSWVRRWCRER